MKKFEYTTTKVYKMTDLNEMGKDGWEAISVVERREDYHVTDDKGKVLQTVPRIALIVRLKREIE